MRGLDRILELTVRGLAIPVLLLTAILVGLAMDASQGGLGTDVETTSITLTDQLGRTSPFFICGSNATTNLTATFEVVISEGGMMPSPVATFAWRTSEGRVVAEIYKSFAYVGANAFISRSTLNLNLSTLAPDLDAYSVTASAGEYQATIGFHICARANLTVFEKNFSSDPAGTLLPEWEIELPGYGEAAQWVEELTFEGRNHVLRMASYLDQMALLSHGINLSSKHIQMGFRMRIWEVNISNKNDLIAMSFGLGVQEEKIPLVELGRSDNQVVFPFDYHYNQGKWFDLNIFLDLGPLTSTSSLYLDGIRVGSKELPPIDPEEVDRFYFSLGGGAYYVGQFDNILVREFALNEGPCDRPAVAWVNVRPSHGQWFDPSGFLVTYSVEITPCLDSNPYLEVGDVQIELWNSTNMLGVLRKAGWNGTGSCSSPCHIVTHSYSCMIPAGLIDVRTEDFHEFHGDFWVKSVPNDPTLVLVSKSSSFHVDDPLDAYFSFWIAGPEISPAIFDREPMNLSLNVEFDPSVRSGNGTSCYIDKTCRVYWFDPNGENLKNETHLMRTHRSYPSQQPWVFSTLPIDEESPVGTYTCLITAICNSGYEVSESCRFTLVAVHEGMLVTFILTAFSIGITIVYDPGDKSTHTELKT